MYYLKKLFLGIIFFIVPSLFSMEKLNEADKTAIKNRLKQIDFALKSNPGSSLNSNILGTQTLFEFLKSQFKAIEEILDKNSIAHPKEKNKEWTDNLRKELFQKK